MNRPNIGEISKAFSELDRFTQEQIARDPEFIEIFPECHLQAIDTRNTEHFRRLSNNDIYGIFLFVVSFTVLLGSVL